MAEFNLLTHLNLNKQELLNARLQNLTTPPTVTANDIGFTYWNIADKTAYSWTGTAWIDLGAVYQHPTYTGTAQPTVPLTGANVISQITLENGHVKAVVTRAITAANIGAATASHTHLFSDITGLPTNTILGNNTAGTGPAKALTVSDLMSMLAIAHGTFAILTAGTDTTQRTWTAKDINDYINDKLNNYILVVDLAYTASPTNGVITNTAGTNATIPAATATNAGLMLPAEKTKLTGVAAGANKYIHPTANPGTHPFATEQTSGLLTLSQLVVNNEGHVVTVKGRQITSADIAAVLFNNASNNATTQTWSASKIYNEIQTAIGQAQTGALQYKGDYNPTTNTPPITTDTTVKVGYTYVVAVSGTFLGEDVEAGDMIIAKTDNPGTTLANWQLVNKNIPALVDATTTVKGIVRLATTAEALAGVLTNVAVTPVGLKAFYDSRIGSHIAVFGDGSTTNFTLTHTLNSKNVHVVIKRVSDDVIVGCEVKTPTNTTITVGMNIAPANGAYRAEIFKIG